MSALPPRKVLSPSTEDVRALLLARRSAGAAGPRLRRTGAQATSTTKKKPKPVRNNPKPPLQPPAVVRATAALRAEAEPVPAAPATSESHTIAPELPVEWSAPLAPLAPPAAANALAESRQPPAAVHTEAPILAAASPLPDPLPTPAPARPEPAESGADSLASPAPTPSALAAEPPVHPPPAEAVTRAPPPTPAPIAPHVDAPDTKPAPVPVLLPPERKQRAPVPAPDPLAASVEHGSGPASPTEGLRTFLVDVRTRSTPNLSRRRVASLLSSPNSRNEALLMLDPVREAESRRLKEARAAAKAYDAARRAAAERDAHYRRAEQRINDAYSASDNEERLRAKLVEERRAWVLARVARERAEVRGRPRSQLESNRHAASQRERRGRELRADARVWGAVARTQRRGKTGAVPWPDVDKLVPPGGFVDQETLDAEEQVKWREFQSAEQHAVVLASRLRAERDAAIVRQGELAHLQGRLDRRKEAGVRTLVPHPGPLVGAASVTGSVAGQSAVGTCDDCETPSGHDEAPGLDRVRTLRVLTEAITVSREPTLPAISTGLWEGSLRSPPLSQALPGVRPQRSPGRDPFDPYLSSMEKEAQQYMAGRLDVGDAGALAQRNSSDRARTNLLQIRGDSK